MEDKHLTEVNNTISYYEEHADLFVKSTVMADMNVLYKCFEKYLKPSARILDLGSGSGRDSKYFTEKGYDVIAIDASSAMCENTRRIAHVPAYIMKAENINFVGEFDAVWACASLLHVEKKNMSEVLKRIVQSLKPEGIAYMSWKYGDSEHYDGIRYYADYTENSMQELLDTIEGIKIINIWLTEDSLSGRENLTWLNVLIQKNILQYQ